MALPLGKEPVQESRMLFESMKEENTFEKNMFNKTKDIVIPKSAKLDR